MIYRSTKISARLGNVLDIQSMLRWLRHDSGGLLNCLDFCINNVVSFVRDYAETCAQMKWCQELRCSLGVRLVYWGTFGVASRVPSSISNFMTKHGTSLETL